MRRFLQIALCLLLGLPSILAQKNLPLMGVGGTAAAAGITENTAQRCVSADNGATCAFAAGGVTSGRFLLCGGAVYNSTSMDGSDITDTVGTSYSVLYYNDVSGLQDLFFAYGFAAGTGANTTTVVSGGAAQNFGCTQYQGVNATPLDVNGGSSSGTSTTPADSVTTVAANAIAVGVMAHISGASSITPGSGYTEIAEQESVVNDPFSLIFKVVVSPGATSVNWTTSTSVWAAATASFKP